MGTKYLVANCVCEWVILCVGIDILCRVSNTSRLL